MWTKFFIIFALLWGLQVYLTRIQIKQYQSQVREYAKRDSGYLGTGHFKKKLGTGAIAILVCDEKLQIVEAKIMKGITIFARFKEREELIGRDLRESWDVDFLNSKESNAVKNAVQMIEKEISKGKGNEAWIS